MQIQAGSAGSLCYVSFCAADRLTAIFPVFSGPMDWNKHLIPRFYLIAKGPFSRESQSLAKSLNPVFTLLATIKSGYPDFKWQGTDHVSQSNLHRNRYLGAWLL
jgi:hypothetical protein